MKENKMVIINKHVELKVPGNPDPIELIAALYDCFKRKGSVSFTGTRVKLVNQINIAIEGYAIIELCSDDWHYGFTLVLKNDKFYIKRKRKKEL
ncbi:MAG: hypothetical protein AB8B74_12955 [Crocinitomicaceae bacterium]